MSITVSTQEDNRQDIQKPQETPDNHSNSIQTEMQEYIVRDKDKKKTEEKKQDTTPLPRFEINILIIALAVMMEILCAIYLFDINILVLCSILVIQIIMGALLYRERFLVFASVILIELVMGFFTDNLILMLMGVIIYGGMIALLKAKDT